MKELSHVGRKEVKECFLQEGNLYAVVIVAVLCYSRY